RCAGIGCGVTVMRTAPTIVRRRRENNRWPVHRSCNRSGRSRPVFIGRWYLHGANRITISNRIGGATVDPIAEAMRDLDAMLGADHPTPTSGQSMAERSKAAQGIGAHCFHPHYFHLLPVPTTFGATLYTTATGVTVAANQWGDTVCPFCNR